MEQPDGEYEADIIKNVRNSSRRKIEYDPAENEIKKVHQYREQTSIEYSPGFEPFQNTMPKKYRESTQFKPKIKHTVVHDGYRTPRNFEKNRKYKFDGQVSKGHESVRNMYQPDTSIRSTNSAYRVKEDSPVERTPGKSPYSKAVDTTL